MVTAFPIIILVKTFHMVVIFTVDYNFYHILIAGPDSLPPLAHVFALLLLPIYET
jgi:hypothetical protein